MRLSILTLATLICISALVPCSLATPITLLDVPAYDWYHGCAPTAAASVIGYWDLHGFPNLFDANGADVFQTDAVKNQISSPEHNARYDPIPDDLTQPQTWSSIADFMHTSEGDLIMGATRSSKVPIGIIEYAASRGYSFNAWNDHGLSSIWMDLVAEIDAGCPLIFGVDVTGNGMPDHAAPVLGYDIRGPNDYWYAVYTTWDEDETISWFQFRRLSNEYSWGVATAVIIHPVSAPVPEPSSFILFGIGLGVIGLAKWLKWWNRPRPTSM